MAYAYSTQSQATRLVARMLKGQTVCIQIWPHAACCLAFNMDSTANQSHRTCSCPAHDLCLHKHALLAEHACAPA